ncbi:MAG: heme biosynthesis protein HemY [Thiotrichales bacterium]|nr:heme biosynthesis protein HemY [Thiotrichales bacterium]
MGKLLKWVVFLVIATVLTSLALQDNGRLSMVWHDWVIETSLSFAIVLAIIVILVFYFLIRLWAFFVHLPRHLRERRALKRQSKAGKTLTKGMIALEYGDWKMAEKQLIKSAKDSPTGLVNYLSAAKMAHNQNAPDRRDDYLSQARAHYPEDYDTIGLVEARLLRDSEPHKAQAILKTLVRQQPKNKVVLAEYAQLLEKLEDWQVLGEILPQLRKLSAIEKSELQRLETCLIAGKVATAENEAALESLWSSLSAKQQLQSDILAEFVEQRMGWGMEQGLAERIAKSLKQQWSDRLVYQYGRIQFGPAFDRFKTAENWLKGREENPVLLLTLGRLACMSQFWGAAHAYLKRSLALQPEIETFHVLAKCYEAEGLESEAALTYKEAILQLEKKNES